MPLHLCIISNQWGGRFYKSGAIYDVTSPPAIWFSSISAEYANEIVVNDTPLPCHKDAEGDWHIDEPVQFDNSVLMNSGYPRFVTETISSDITLGVTHYAVICTATLSVTLPSAAVGNGRFYNIKSAHDNAGTVTIIGTIDGDVNPTLIAGECFTIYSDGTAWRIL